MREILFRAKRKDNGEWVCGLPFKAYSTFYRDYLWTIQYLNKFGIPIAHYDIIPETIGQYTIFKEAIEILDINAICSPRATQFKKAVDLAKEALEKQIPKKPRETRCALMCANCGHKITEKGCKKRNRLYCKKCGQAICWDNEVGEN